MTGSAFFGLVIWRRDAAQVEMEKVSHPPHVRRERREPRRCDANLISAESILLVVVFLILVVRRNPTQCRLDGAHGGRMSEESSSNAGSSASHPAAI